MEQNERPIHAMEVTAILQKLAAYEPRRSQKSQQLLDEGTAHLKNNAYSKQGDEGMYQVAPSH